MIRLNCGLIAETEENRKKAVGNGTCRVIAPRQGMR